MRRYQVAGKKVRDSIYQLFDNFTLFCLRYADENAGEDPHFWTTSVGSSLESKNIQTRNLFAGNIIKHPCFDGLQEGVDYRVVGSLANTDTIMNSALWIGLYPGMGESKLDYMIKTIRDFSGWFLGLAECGYGNFRFGFFRIARIIQQWRKIRCEIFVPETSLSG